MSEQLADYGLILLFGIVALQAAGVGGLPGKTALVAAAILAARGHFSISAVIAVAASGVMLGGYVGYAVARTGGRPLVERPFLKRRVGRWLDIADRFFEAHGTKAVFLARFFPGLKVVAAPAAGLARMPWLPFALWHAAASIAFALVFGLTAYFIGEGVIDLVEAFGVYALLLVIALLGVGWLLWRRYRAAAAPS